MSKNALIIAAPWSGSGKTTLCLLLASYFKHLGKKVQCFKCGPDYLDSNLHEKITGKPAINLDRIMMSDAHVWQLFSKYHNDADISIVEGMMGLFDGAIESKGSTASIARLLGIPIILTISCKGMGYGVAALLEGLLNFDKEISIKGIIFNKVGSEKHQKLLLAACKKAGVPCFGMVPNDEALHVPSRHLGLRTEGDLTPFINRGINIVKEHLKTNELTDLKTIARAHQNVKSAKNKPDKIIAVARDEAFYFYYEENLDALAKWGQLIFFSPINDKEVPTCDMIYIGGGYPENHLKSLSTNTAMRIAIKEKADKGVKIWASCGGMMYLGKTIIGKGNIAYEMASVFDFSTSIAQPKLHLGYRYWRCNNHVFCGHEFHYTSLINAETTKTIGHVWDIHEQKTNTPVFRHKNCIASYLHLYWAENLDDFLAIFSNFQ